MTNPMPNERKSAEKQVGRLMAMLQHRDIDVVTAASKVAEQLNIIYDCGKADGRNEGLEEAAETCQNVERKCRADGRLHTHAEVGCDYCHQAIEALKTK